MGESRAAEGVDDYGLARSRTRRTLGLPAGLSWKMRSVWPGPSQISRGGSEPTAGLTRVHWMILDWSNILLLALSGLGQISECPLCARSGRSPTVPPERVITTRPPAPNIGKMRWRAASVAVSGIQAQTDEANLPTQFGKSPSASFCSTKSRKLIPGFSTNFCRCWTTAF